ncbi:hypothetical protein FQA39_LY10167 [Lamprigera yunnana]|nr:hypothetical protein FQA39_LY10167 [Lamprigera yunnana]
MKFVSAFVIVAVLFSCADGGLVDLGASGGLINGLIGNGGLISGLINGGLLNIDLNKHLQDLLNKILTPLLKCVLDKVELLAKEDLVKIVNELASAIGTVSKGCLVHNINNATQLQLIEIVKCLVKKAGQVSGDQLVEIVKQLVPVLAKVNCIVTCVQDALADICKGVGICDLPLVGPILCPILKQICIALGVK